MSHIKRHWILYLFTITTTILSIVFPDTEIKLVGALGWFLLNTVFFISLIMIIIGLKGGEITYSSKGAIPLLKKFIGKENEIHKEEGQ